MDIRALCGIFLVMGIRASKSASDTTAYVDVTSEIMLLKEHLERLQSEVDTMRKDIDSWDEDDSFIQTSCEQSTQTEEM